MAASRFERPTDKTDLASYEDFLEAERAPVEQLAVEYGLRAETASQACEFMKKVQLTHAYNMNFIAETESWTEADEELLEFTVHAGFIINAIDGQMREGHVGRIYRLSSLHQRVSESLDDQAVHSYTEGIEYQAFCEWYMSQDSFSLINR